MFALSRLALATRNATYNRWAVELAQGLLQIVNLSALHLLECNDAPVLLN